MEEFDHPAFYFDDALAAVFRLGEGRDDLARPCDIRRDRSEDLVGGLDLVEDGSRLFPAQQGAPSVDGMTVSDLAAHREDGPSATARRHLGVRRSRKLLTVSSAIQDVEAKLGSAGSAAATIMLTAKGEWWRGPPQVPLARRIDFDARFLEARSFSPTNQAASPRGASSAREGGQGRSAGGGGAVAGMAGAAPALRRISPARRRRLSSHCLKQWSAGSCAGDRHAGGSIGPHGPWRMSQPRLASRGRAAKPHNVPSPDTDPSISSGGRAFRLRQHRRQRRRHSPTRLPAQVAMSSLEPAWREEEFTTSH